MRIKTSVFALVFLLAIFAAPMIMPAIKAQPTGLWYAGAYWSIPGCQTASSISGEIEVPNSPQVFNQSSAIIANILISCEDSNNSYDQIGLTSENNGNGTYLWYVEGVWTANGNSGISGGIGFVVPTGGCYAFNMTAQNGVITFLCYEGSTQLFNYSAPTGGNYLQITASYTDYEEIELDTNYTTPSYDFYFYNQEWTSTNGTSYVAANWLPQYIAISGVNVAINGNSVLVENPGVTLTPQFVMCAMKGTTTGCFGYVPNIDGWFNIPSVPMGFLKIEELFSNANLTGDQTGGVSPYPSIANWPDGKVDVRDANLVAKAYGSQQGSSGWNYMADVTGPGGYPDGLVNIYDENAVSANYGKSGTYITNLTNVTVWFPSVNCYAAPDTNGFVPIPYGMAGSFYVYQNNVSIGALTTFWTP